MAEERGTEQLRQALAASETSRLGAELQNSALREHLAGAHSSLEELLRRSRVHSKEDALREAAAACSRALAGLGELLSRASARRLLLQVLHGWLGACRAAASRRAAAARLLELRAVRHARAALAGWRQLAASRRAERQRVGALSSRASAFARRWLLCRSLRAWQGEYARRRLLAISLLQLRRRSQVRLCVAALRAWRERSCTGALSERLGVAASRLLQRASLQRLLRAWQRAAAARRSRRELVARALQRRSHALAARLFDCWRAAASSSRRLTLAMLRLRSARHLRLARAAFGAWLAEAQQSRQEHAAGQAWLLEERRASAAEAAAMVASRSAAGQQLVQPLQRATARSCGSLCSLRSKCLSSTQSGGCRISRKRSSRLCGR